MVRSRPLRWFASVAGVALLVAGCGDTDSAGADTTLAAATTTLAASTTAVETTTTIGETPATGALVVGGGVPIEWNQILATTKAKPLPPAATCPDGAKPDAPGPADQIRPGEGPWSNQAAVFDAHAGRIVYVDETGETWTFDVCTNTWHQTKPMGMPFEPWASPWDRPIGEMVYDADSDRTITIGPDFVAVYNANTNEWRQRSAPSGLDLGFGSPGLGAVYDPVSGLVLVVTYDGVLMTYDVDSDEWTDVGLIVEPLEVTSEGQTQTLGPPFLVGHIAEADRLAFLGFNSAPFQDIGGLINPRAGETEPLTDPPGGVDGGFGSFSYATGGETAYTYANGVCRLDPVTFDWDCITNGQAQSRSAMVYDPINDRLVLINDWCCSWPGTTVTDNVQAIDFNTGETLELLSVANTRVTK